MMIKCNVKLDLLFSCNVFIVTLCTISLTLLLRHRTYMSFSVPLRRGTYMSFGGFQRSMIHNLFKSTRIETKLVSFDSARSLLHGYVHNFMLVLEFILFFKPKHCRTATFNPWRKLKSWRRHERMFHSLFYKNTYSENSLYFIVK